MVVAAPSTAMEEVLAQAREAVVAAATVEEAADTTAEHWIFPQPLWLN
jgi:hypothetical protein